MNGVPHLLIGTSKIIEVQVSHSSCSKFSSQSLKQEDYMGRVCKSLVPSSLRSFWSKQKHNIQMSKRCHLHIFAPAVSRKRPRFTDGFENNLQLLHVFCLRRHIRVVGRAWQAPPMKFEIRFSWEPRQHPPQGTTSEFIGYSTDLGTA